MIGGAVNTICPPGFFCMDTGFVFLVGLILLAIGFAAYTYSNNINRVPKEKYKNSDNERQQTVKIIVESPTKVAAPNQMSASLYPPPPDRDYDNRPDLRGFVPPPNMPIMPINFPTRGLPQEFQQMGVLTAPGGSSTSASPNRTLLPLLGRRSANSRDRYNYYTRTDGLNPIQVPVSFKNRGCDDDTGCDEIMSGDTVGVPLLGQTYTATVYKYNTPRYIPGII
jgi:hypothetical protein